MLWSAVPQGECLSYDHCQCESFNYIPSLHTVCSMELNKRRRQSLAHLGVRCCISVTLINDTEPEWEHDTVMDSPPQLIKLGEFNME